MDRGLKNAYTQTYAIIDTVTRHIPSFSQLRKLRLMKRRKRFLVRIDFSRFSCQRRKVNWIIIRQTMLSLSIKPPSNEYSREIFLAWVQRMLKNDNKKEMGSLFAIVINSTKTSDDAPSGFFFSFFQSFINYSKSIEALWIFIQSFMNFSFSSSPIASVFWIRWWWLVRGGFGCHHSINYVNFSWILWELFSTICHLKKVSLDSHHAT